MSNIKEYMRRECDAVQKMTEECGTQYDEILEVLKACRGKIVFMGVGKSGHIGKSWRRRSPLRVRPLFLYMVRRRVTAISA